MRPVEPPPTQGTLSIQDILFVVFRHKWKIAILSLLGLAAAASVHFRQKPSFRSEAKLLVHYVVERSPIDTVESQMGTSGSHGAAVMFAEMELLRTQDLALEVARDFGPDKIIPNAEHEVTLPAATGRIQSGLEVNMRKGSNVLYVSFHHDDPQVAREVLGQLLTHYLGRHLELHRRIGAHGLVTENRDKIRGQLRTTVEELNRLKKQAGVINLATSIQNLDQQIAATRRDLLQGEAAVAEQKAWITALENIARAAGPGAAAARQAADALPQPGADDVAEYLALTASLQRLHAQRLDLDAKFKPGSREVRRHEEQIRRVDGERSALVQKFPTLLTKENRVPGKGPSFDTVQEKALLARIAAKTEEYRRQLDTLQTEHEELASISGKIEELERRKRVEEEMYTNLELSLEKARADNALDPSKIPNISVLEKPTFASRFYSSDAKKLIMGLAASGAMAGLCWAFLIEFFLDHRVKRPQELERRLHIPLMLAIPHVDDRRRTPRLALSEGGRSPRPEIGLEDEIFLPDIPDSGVTSPAAVDPEHFIHPYAKAIRDRIVYHFELNEIGHKPKLVALTSLSDGAGTTTVAAGLAKAFAEGGAAKVLLVDLASGSQSNGTIPGGAVTCTLDHAVRSGREGSPDNGRNGGLYLARVQSETNGGEAAPFAPKHLYDLMPELRSSEFDYIIFDMPPVGPTSPTVAMAGIMDQVLLVLDAGNTNRSLLKRNYAELSKGRADVSCVFNKRRQKNPRWLEEAV